MAASKELKELLNKNREKICSTIVYYKFCITLREHCIFDQSDEESVYNFHISTTAQKNSHLIDLITQKGEKGMIVFLEKIGFEYPDLYKEITGKEAPPKPIREECHGPSRVSLNLLTQMGLMISSFTEGFVIKKRVTDELKDIIADLEKNNIKMISEIQDLKEKISKLEKEKINVQGKGNRFAICRTRSSIDSYLFNENGNESTEIPTTPTSSGDAASGLNRKPAIKQKTLPNRSDSVDTYSHISMTSSGLNGSICA